MVRAWWWPVLAWHMRDGGQGSWMGVSMTWILMFGVCTLSAWLPAGWRMVRRGAFVTSTLTGSICLRNAGLHAKLRRPHAHWARRRPVGSLQSWMLPRLVRPVLWALSSYGCNSSPGDIWTFPEISTNLRELCDVISCPSSDVRPVIFHELLSNTPDPRKLSRFCRFKLRFLPFLPLRFKMMYLYILLFVLNKWYVLLTGSWCVWSKNVEYPDRVISPGNFGWSLLKVGCDPMLGCCDLDYSKRWIPIDALELPCWLAT